MNNEPVIIPSHEADWTFLSRSKQGRTFKKHILSLGDLRHPVTGKLIHVDEAFFATMKQNFENKVCDIVQVPLANDKNEHSEDPDRNIGEVVDLQIEGNKIYAYIDARDSARADKLGKTLLGASAMMHLDYTDTKTGQKVGPTLLHTCVTNRPYITDLDDYQEIVLASADKLDDAVVLLTDVAPSEEKEIVKMTMTREELLAELKEKHGLDVAALESQASLSKTIADALTEAGAVKLSAQGEVSSDEVVAAVAELATNNISLSNRVDTLGQEVSSLKKADAEREVGALVAEGKIAPSAQGAMVELRLSNVDLYNKLVPAEAVINLSKESGTSEEPPVALNAKEVLDAELTRILGDDDPRVASLFGKK